MKLKDGFLLRTVAGQAVVLPSDADVDFNDMITLNETGSTLWKRLEQGAEREDLIRSLLDEYEVDEATAGIAVDSFVQQMKELGLLA